MNGKILLLAASIVFTGCAASSPNLYSPVYPMESGINKTEPTAKTREKSNVRATRNVERYCTFYGKQPQIVSVKTSYKGIYQSEKAADTVNSAQSAVLGGVVFGSGTDWKTTIEFRCI